MHPFKQNRAYYFWYLEVGCFKVWSWEWFVEIVSLFIVSFGVFGFFFRNNELEHIKRSDISFCDTNIEIIINKSKTDKYRRSNRTGNQLCPVKWLSVYLKVAGLQESSDYFIFRSLSYFNTLDIYKLSKANIPLSYTRARELLFGALEQIGLKKSKSGLHNLRSGDVSETANNGVSERSLKAHGRWHLIYPRMVILIIICKHRWWYL